MKKVSLLMFLIVFMGVASYAVGQTAITYDTLSVYDIEFVSPESLAVGQDDSRFVGDTVVVEGIVATGPRSLWIGNRWSGILVDENGGPWSAIQIVQNDTMQAGTNFSALKVGYKVRITGIVDEFTYGASESHSEIFIIDTPPVPVELIGFGYDIPEPMEVTCADLAIGVGEQYENTLVVIKNATVVNNNLPSYQMLISDATGQITVDEWSLDLYKKLRAGTYSWPANGTNIDIMGHIKSNPNGTGFEIGPRSEDDIIILTNPPQISNVTRVPAAPTSNDDVVVSAKVKDNGTIDKVRLHFRVDGGLWQLGNMSTTDSVYTRTLPKQADGAFVEYFIRAEDTDGDFSMMPGDTSTSMYFYTVRDAGLTIKDLQYTPFKDGNSGYLGMEITVEGIVTASPDDFLGDYMIQTDQSPWSGIWVNDAAHTPHRGDLVRVTGTIEEDYNVTRINSVTAFDSLGTGTEIEPLKITTGQATTGSDEAESYEGVLLQFDDVIVSNPFPDASNYGEIAINDGTGSYRVDENGTYAGNFDSTYALNDKIETIRGIGWFSFYNYKLEPRGIDDVIGHVPAAVEDVNTNTVQAYELHQNYPNPFNPVTTIQFNIGKTEHVELAVYNVLGQKIRTLVSDYKSAGRHIINWDGRNNNGQIVATGLYFYTLKAGDFIQTNKMIFLQ